MLELVVDFTRLLYAVIVNYNALKIMSVRVRIESKSMRIHAYMLHAYNIMYMFPLCYVLHFLHLHP